MYVYTHIYVKIDTFIYIHTYLYLYTHIYIHTYIHIIHTHIHIGGEGKWYEHTPQLAETDDTAAKKRKRKGEDSAEASSQKSAYSRSLLPL
jgi:hypothetical protein